MALRLVLGDQLSHNISSLSDIDPQKDLVLMCEVWEEATYVKHHKKKIAFLFSAMRHFAEEMTGKGFHVHYTKLDDPKNRGTFRGEVERAIQAIGPEHIVVTAPSEYRVLKDMKKWESAFGMPVEIRPDSRFLISTKEFADWADGRKHLRMEYFYREVRKKYGTLMSGDKPEGGKWNYDRENRKPPKKDLHVPQTYMSQPDPMTQDVMALVRKQFAHHFGDLEPFHFAVTREQALCALDQFIAERLSSFGDWQDAMVQGEPWMYHSCLSFYLNCGLLEPLECCERAEAAYYDGTAPLNAVEGFIRQIAGWREYIRGIYWLKMPKYENENFLNAARKLPSLYWDGGTHMNCMKQCVDETRANAYAHHIQRLMVLGNFALLGGIHPNEVNEWYLSVYADAYQWVELPNVTGMTLFADGGVLGSKPYAASGAYINKMSDYCKTCHYQVNKKDGPKACPFNYLYWDFLIRNEEVLRGNPRLTMGYRALDRMNDKKKLVIKNDAAQFLKALERGKKV